MHPPSHTISTDSAHRELQFTISGMWKADTMGQFLADLTKAAAPFIKSGQPWSAIGDLREFVAQDRETAGAIQDSLEAAAKNGMQRFAVITSSSLVRLQYKRITSNITADFFDTPAQAHNWLRQ